MSSSALSMCILGLASSFAVGPASFSIIRQLINQKKWPWPSILGFIFGDIIYISFALIFLQSSIIHEQWLKNLLTLLTIIVLLFYSFKVILYPDEKRTEACNQGFSRSLLLTLSNFHLLFIYAGIFIHLTDSGLSELWQGVGLYFSAFVFGFLALLWSLKKFHFYLQIVLRKIEIVAACGFFGFSIYLSLGML